MKNVKFFSGQIVESDDLNNAQAYKEEEILSRELDMRIPGVLRDTNANYTIVAIDSTATLINVNGFTAYDDYGNRIFIAKSYENDTITPSITSLKLSEKLVLDETGRIQNPNIKLSTEGFLFPYNYKFNLVVRKTEVLDAPSRKHVSTGTMQKVTEKDTYEFWARFNQDTSEGDVLLASVSVGEENKLTIDESVRKVSHFIENSVVATYNIDSKTSNYGSGGEVTLTDHVNAHGTGTVSDNNPHGLSPSDLGIDTTAIIEHQAKSHCDGIRSDNINSVESALYPLVVRHTASNSDYIIIYPLSPTLNELLVANGTAFNPTQIRNQTRISMLNRGEGDYAICFDTRNVVISLFGPYTAANYANYVQLLNNRAFFNICKFQWGVVNYDLDNDGEPDASGYDILPGTFKDLRTFNHTSVETTRPDEVFALSQFAPLVKDVAHIHNAKIVNSKTSSAYPVGGKQLGLIIDGGEEKGGYNITVTFVGSSLLAVDDIVEQIQAALYDQVANDIIAYTHVTDEGNISISAPLSIAIAPAASVASAAAPILGFDSTLEDSSDLVKELVYTGARNGLIVYTYNDSDEVIRVDYFLGGGVKRTNTFIYKSGIITAVTEEISDL